MSLQLLFISVVLVISSANEQVSLNHQIPPNVPTMDPNMMEMMLPPFLRQASEAAKKEFELIVTDRNLKKSEIGTKLSEWASRQSNDVKEGFEYDQKMQADMTAMMDSQRERLVKGLSKEAQAVAAKIDAIRRNQELTPDQEITQVNEVIKETSASVLDELRSVDSQMAPMGDAEMPFADLPSPW